MANRSFLGVYCYCLFFLILILSVSSNKKKLIVKGECKTFKKILFIIFVLYLIICLAMGVQRGGIDARAFSFTEIYQMRAEYDDSSGISGYLASWCAKSMFPIFTSYFLYLDKKKYVFLCILAQLFLYFCFGYKGYLFSIFFVVFLYYTLKKYNSSQNDTVILLGFILLSSLSLLIYFEGILGIIGKNVSSVFAMRMLFEPSRIAFGYIDFFSGEEKLYFSEGIIGHLLGIPYRFNEPIGYVLTKYMNGIDVISNSNTGIISDSYAELGMCGVVIISCLTGFIFKFIERATNYIPSFVVMASLGHPIVILNATPLLTNILTNGWALDIILLMIINGSLIKKLSIPLNDRINNMKGE